MARTIDYRPTVAFLVVVLAILVACGTASYPDLAPKVAPGSSITTPATALPRQQEWDNLVAEAKKEGNVIIVSAVSSGVRDGLSRAFQEKYGVGLEFVSGRTEESTAKVLAERRAGLYLRDAWIGGGSSDAALGAADALEPIEPVLLLPEILDKKAWWGNELLWNSPDHLRVLFLASPLRPLTINTELVRIEEIKSFRDLLQPKWKGKITFFDPTGSGGGINIFFMLADSDLGTEYLRKLGEQEIAITRDVRMMTEWVARGKYPIGVGIARDSQRAFEQAGAPIKAITPVEGTIIGAGSGGVAILKKAPHPRASRLFVNWLLSKEGQTLASKLWGAQTAREDVPTSALDPDVLRESGAKYMPVFGVEYDSKVEHYQKTARDLWGYLMK
ncbi:MAG: extracellular solute-binding protein [Chloroflexi bacterium]|nr:extracellular solute-binding protein [Chloroflexota bacterium]